MKLYNMKVNNPPKKKKKIAKASAIMISGIFWKVFCWNSTALYNLTNFSGCNNHLIGKKKKARDNLLLFIIMKQSALVRGAKILSAHFSLFIHQFHQNPTVET